MKDVYKIDISDKTLDPTLILSLNRSDRRYRALEK